MGKTAQFWANDVSLVIQRFPVPIACAVALTLIQWPLISPDYLTATDIGNPKTRFPLSLFFAAGFFWSWGAALWGESRKQKGLALGLSLFGLVVLALVFRGYDAAMLWLGWRDYQTWAGHNSSHAFLFGFLFFGPVLAPYLRTGVSQSAFWQFSHKWVVAFLAAGLGGLLAYLGIWSILKTAELLFDLEVSSQVYNKAAIIASCLIFPSIWLVLTPQDFADEVKTGSQQEFTSRAVALLVSYILIPVSAALSLLLVAYVAKVLWEGSFSTARLGLMSLSYATAVILIALMAYPQRKESSYVSLFWRVFPFLLIAPSVLFFPALWIRVSEYGWTQQRYLALIAGLWVVAIAILFVIPRIREDLRLIPGLLAAALAITAFGPWGVSSVSARSQFDRLEKFAIENGWIADGKWKGRPNPDIRLARQADAYKTVSTALKTIERSGQIDRLRPWFDGTDVDPFRKPHRTAFADLTTKFGVDANSRHWQTRQIRTAYPHRIPVKENSFAIGPLTIGHTKSTVDDATLGKLTTRLDGHSFSIEDENGRAKRVDIAPILENAFKDNSSPKSWSEAQIVDGAGDLSVSFAITELTAQVGTETTNATTIRGYLIVPAN